MRKSPLDKYVSTILLWIRERKSNVEIATLLSSSFGVETTESSVRRLIERHETLREADEERKIFRDLEAQAEAAGVKTLPNGDVEVTLPANDEDKPVSHLTIADVMDRHGLDPEEWQAKTALPNVWEANAGEGKKIKLYQFKVWFTRKVPISVIYPASVGPAIRTPKSIDRSKSLLAVVCGDPQNPFRLPELEELFQRWLAHNRPDVGVINGDLMNLAYIGRHRDNPTWDDRVQEAIQSSFDWIHGLVQASPDTAWSLRKGNHDDRIRNEQLERNERLYGVTAAQFPGDEPEEYVYSFNHLLHLKRLGVDYVETDNTYEFQHVALSDCISVRHGHLVGKDAPLKTVERLGHSVVLGHTHKQSISKRTLWNSISNTWKVVTAIEHGPMCQLEGGLGYANAGFPDWQPGWATIQLFPNGSFTADLATFSQHGEVVWRDQQFTL